MKKIIVIGSGGAGKSTFSKRLGKVLGLEVIHLDQLYWKPNWVKTPKDEWAKVVGDLVKRESWVVDGNFGGTREMRIRACDAVVFLDIPRRVCLYRIVKRVIVYRRKTRPDMAEGCNEKLDLEFFLWVWNYPNRAKKRIVAMLEKFPDKEIIVLRSTREVESFLTSVAV